MRRFDSYRGYAPPCNAVLQQARRRADIVLDEDGPDRVNVDIEIVGAVRPEQAHGEAVVQALLAAPVLDLDHDGTFTGRPVTRVRATAEHVLKERDALPVSVSRSDLRFAVAELLDRERLLDVHPPDKTWFTVEHDGERRLGNVTARRTPLHLPEAQRDPERFTRHLQTMLEMYIHVAAQFQARLDEGLSNFAYDDDDVLRYVDDDVYPWDDFAHFNQSVGVTIRRARTLSPGGATILGQAVGRAVLTGFGDAASCRQIADTVRGLYFNGIDQEQRRDGFVAGLLDVTPRTRVRRPTTDRPFALLADVHANHPALLAVIEDVRSRGVDHALVLGDLVGYGPHPRECLSTLRDAGFEILRGNHDQAAATGVRPPGFNAAAHHVIEWTRGQLDPADLAWLARLPTRIERDGWRAQHGAPMDPTYFNAYVYRLTYEDNLAYMAEHGLRLAFHGHSHTPGVYFSAAATTGLDEREHQSLSGHQHALVCPGSVGQPRRGGTHAQWALFDPVTMDLVFHSVAYDLERTVADMQALGFPARLVDRLRAGT